MKQDNIYDNFYTNETFYDFLQLLAQQNETKKLSKKASTVIVLKNIYISFLQEFDLHKVDKFDLHTNKNAKYIFYRYNSYLELSHQKKQIIRHTKKVKGKVGLEKSQKKKIGNI